MFIPPYSTPSGPNHFLSDWYLPLRFTLLRRHDVVCLQWYQLWSSALWLRALQAPLSPPFTSESYCGPPEFRLTRSSWHPPPLSYRVLRLNQTDRTMTLARSDLWIGTTRTTCLTEFTNTTLLNSTLLNCSPHNEDLTIFYGSSNFTMKPSNLFNCSINGTSSTAFYLTGPILNIATCSVGVRLKILQTVAHELSSNRITLREALMEGFNVNYGDCGIQPCRTPGIRAFSPVKIAFFAFGCEWLLGWKCIS